MSRPDLHERHRAFRETMAAVERAKEAQRPQVDFDPGETLATFARGPLERLRLARKSYQQRPYIDLRVEWRTPTDETWKPSRKGLTLKRGELAGLAQALLDADGGDQ